MGTAFMDALVERGFERLHTGGGCEAMFRLVDGSSEVITSMDGGGLPEAEDWLFCRYEGDWTEDTGVPEIEGHDSDGTLCDLITLLDA